MTTILYFLIAVCFPNRGSFRRKCIIVPCNKGASYCCKIGDKTRWKVPLEGPLWHSSYNGITVVDSSEILIVDPTGRVISELQKPSVLDPRSCLFGKNAVCVSLGNWREPPDFEDSAKSGEEMYSMLWNTRFTEIYDVRTKKEIAMLRTMVMGVVISSDKVGFEAVKILNLKECLKSESNNSEPIPKVRLLTVSFGGRSILRLARVRVPKPDRWSFMDMYINEHRFPPAKVYWNGSSVKIFNLWGINCLTGKSLLSARIPLPKGSIVSLLKPETHPGSPKK